ncbi:MAG: site-2 protease family protein [Actinomycetota bacterium]|nr:site-2 protease family protein [Actinomycetota bacterium]
MVGGLMMAIGIVAMVMIHEGGHFLAAKAVGMKVTEFFFGFGPRLWSIRRGETEYGAKALPLGGYVKIVGMNPYEEVPPQDEGRTYREKPFWAKSLVVLAGIASHFVVAYLLLFLVLAVVGVHDPRRPLPVVFEVAGQLEDGTTSPAGRVGLQQGDRIVGLAGEPVGSWEELALLIREHPEQRVELVVERDGELVESSVTLAARQDEESGETIGFLGIVPELAVTRVGPIEAAGRAATSVAEITRLSVVGLGQLVRPETLSQYVSAVLEGSEVPPEIRPTSPVGLVRYGAQAERLGLEVLFGLLAAVNVFVGVFNFVPLYPLDGGHFAVALYEKVSGREADVRKLTPVAAAVIAFFIFLGIVAIYFDIVGPLPGLG